MTTTILPSPQIKLAENIDRLLHTDPYIESNHTRVQTDRDWETAFIC